LKTPFLSGFNVGRSTNVADDVLINLYPEFVKDTKEGSKEAGALYGTPGLELNVTLPAGQEVRAIFKLPSVTSGSAYAVAKDKFYELSGTPGALTATVRGTLNTTTGPVYIIYNGLSQFLVVDGTEGWVWDGATFTKVLSAALNGIVPNVCETQDGFAFVNGGTTSSVSTQFFQSLNGDFATWNAANYGNANSQNDSIVGIVSLNRELWIFKYGFIEIWGNAGLANFAFQRAQGVYIETGSPTGHTIQKVGQTLMWMGLNRRGGYEVYMANGYNAQRVSTNAIEYLIQSQSSPFSLARAWTYQQGGHTFYCLFISGTIPLLVYDITTGIWHQRTSNGTTNAHLGICCAYSGNANLHYVGDRSSGKIYNLKLETYQDESTAITRQRIWRALPPATNPMEPRSFSQLAIDMETGVSANGTTLSLDWSDDGGHTFKPSSPMTSSVGAAAAYAQRVTFKRLGATKRGEGLDRLFRLTGTDNMRYAFTAANLQ
jgi:hypothetical protein